MSVSTSNKEKLLKIYEILLSEAGPRHWWPAKTRFEVMIGAILTQNTAWKNVEKAIVNLKKAGALSFKKFSSLNEKEIAKLIKPSGYFNQKAKRLAAFCRFIKNEYGGIIDNMRKQDTALLRKKLLDLNGIGPETADSILLYALDKPIFVIDLYTKRILSRHNLLPFNATYDEYQKFFMDNLPHNTQLYNEYHALLVFAGNNYCRRKPKCSECPLLGFNGHNPAAEI
ncbi:MAG: endonuclease III domain-containing protein [Candidatus Schekmanbacteria bacterium]|nr:MAG: endonuclease III domain-containing protein [Candidatus Schekmanbacteria bacterium]